MKRFVFIALFALTACAAPDGASQSSVEQSPSRPKPTSTSGKAECQKVESGDLKVGLELTLAGVTLRVAALQPKADSPGELVGFTVVASGRGLSYLVKAGGDAFCGSASEWTNPNGTSGPKASAISHVDFCVGDTSGGIPDDSVGGAHCACDPDGGAGGTSHTPEDSCTGVDCPVGYTCSQGQCIGAIP
jgi:hypothetical protein